MPDTPVTDLAELERRLWAAADSLRANSSLTPAEYRGPVLGLIFLAFAEHRFDELRPELELKATERRPVSADDFRARGVLFVPDIARLSWLVDLPEGEDLGANVDLAMDAVEATNTGLQGVLPRGYQKLEKNVLLELVRLFAPLPRIVSGDAFGLIYEYFLAEFAASEAVMNASESRRPLDDPRLRKLENLIRRSFRVRDNQTPIYVDVAENLERIGLPQHQIVFGRRGSGKSCLLIFFRREVAPTKGVHTIYILGDTVKTLEYPDVLIRLLLAIFEGLAPPFTTLRWRLPGGGPYSATTSRRRCSPGNRPQVLALTNLCPNCRSNTPTTSEDDVRSPFNLRASKGGNRTMFTHTKMLLSVLLGACVAALALAATSAVAGSRSTTSTICSHGTWLLRGNSWSEPNCNYFLGTIHNDPLALRVGDKQALLLMPHKVSPNLVGGFFENSIRADVRGGTIGGGGRATTTDIGAGGAPNHVEGYFGTVSGGEDNIAGNRNEEPQYQRGATVGGGINNRARDEGATVAGGSTNKATASRSTVGGGGINDADGAAATVGGGFFNRATGEKSTIAGGFSNTASGTYSAIPGGHLNTAGGDHSLAAGSEANATQAGSFVWGDDSGKGNSLSSYGANTVSFGATGGARFVTAYSGGNPSAGVKLASGGGSWSSLSDRAAKRNLRPVDRRALLSKLAAVPVYSWGYKTQSPSIRHLGPMAQGFRSAFGLGEDNKHIDTIDSEGIALAAIQGLYRQNQALAHRNRELNSRLDRQKHMLTHKNKALNARLDRQHQALTRLERKVAPLLAKQH